MMTPEQRLNLYTVELEGVAPHHVPMVAVIDMRDSPASVTVYDKRFNFSQHGQKISSYWLSTLLNHSGGLDLEGSVDSWSIDAHNFDALRRQMVKAYNAGVLVPPRSAFEKGGA